jgi:hypothetical protein
MTDKESKATEKESDKDIKQFINALKKYKRKNGTKKRS